jgi:hypothetical protein
MRDEPLNHQPQTMPQTMPQTISQTVTEADRLDQRLTHALETAPDPQVPADFAARVATLLPARRPVSLTPTHYGHYSMLASVVILMAALLVLAPRTTDRSVLELSLQWLLCAQFIGLAVWLSTRRRSES